MKKGLIAILALASLWGSSVPAMALTIRLHVHAGHEDAQPASKAQDHSCCPDSHAQFVPALFVIPASAPMPCQDSPCCVRQAPGNSIALPSTVRLSRPDSRILATRTLADDGHQNRVRTIPNRLDTDPFELSAIRTVVLRN